MGMIIGIAAVGLFSLIGIFSAIVVRYRRKKYINHVRRADKRVFFNPASQNSDVERGSPPPPHVHGGKNMLFNPLYNSKKSSQSSEFEHPNPFLKG